METTLRTRIDSKQKDDLSKAFKAIGLNMSEGLREIANHPYEIAEALLKIKERQLEEARSRIEEARQSDSEKLNKFEVINSLNEVADDMLDYQIEDFTDGEG